MPLRQIVPDPNTTKLSVADAAAREAELQVDIIAVHGLNPKSADDEKHAFETWTKNGRLWLRDLKDLAPKARVFLYVYNSKFIFGGDKHNFLLAANELLAAIFNERKKCPNRPIILMGHSLGGLLIEQAIINAFNSKRYRPIKDAISTIVFFGTPHEGGNKTLVTLGSAAVKIARFIGVQKNSDLDKTLQAGSLFADMREFYFQNRKLGAMIVSFWEGEGNIVSRASATFGLPDDKEIEVEIKAGHSDICRFDGKTQRDLDNFKLVWGTLEDEYDRALRKGLATLHRYIASCLQRVDETIRPIQSDSPSLDDLQWFTNTTSYHDWMGPARKESQLSHLLWLQNNEDSGFAVSYVNCKKLISADVLLADCSWAKGASPNSWTEWFSFEPNAVDIILWSLLSQALHRIRTDIPLALEQCGRHHHEIMETLKEGGQRLKPSQLVEMLQSALKWRMSDAVIILDKVHLLDPSDLGELKSLIQKMLYQQGLVESAQTRAIVVSPASPEMASIFGDIATICRDTEYHECLKSLAHARMDQRRDRIARAEAGTNHWIWNDEVYNQFEFQRSAMLWVYGKPGSGKSVLASSIVKKFRCDRKEDEEKQNGSPVICSWFYSKRDDLQSHLLMLRAIVLQILRQDKPLFRFMTSLYRQRTPYNEDSFWTSKELLEILKDIVSNSQEQRPMLCILDGLDESYKDKNEDEMFLSDILDALLDFVGKSSNFKVILLSRPDLDIRDKLGSCGKICMQAANSVDIHHVIDKGLLSLITQVNSEENDLEEGDGLPNTPQQNLLLTFDRHPSILSEQITALFETLDDADKQCCYRIKTYLVDNADGVFLWVKTIISALELSAAEPFCSLVDLEAELYDLPQEDLDNLYADVVMKLKSNLKTNSGKAKAKRALIWTAVNARNRSLHLPYLLDALSIDDDVQRALSRASDPLKSKKVRILVKFERELQRLCGPFLEIVPVSATDPPHSLNSRENDLMQYQVQLLHQTAKDFLERDPRADFLKLPSNAMDIVKTDSLAYLQTAFPENPTRYDPLSIIRNGPVSKAVETILLYLQDKVLLPFILICYPQIGWSIPSRYRDIFRSIVLLLQGPDQPSAEDVAEEFFLKVCLDGQILALENLLRIQFVYPVEQCNDFVTECSRYEVPAIRGALRAAIRGDLKNEVEIFIWYVGVRGLNILELPARFNDAVGKNIVIREALEFLSPKILLKLVGYRDVEDMRNRSHEIQISMVENKRQAESKRKVVPLSDAREAIRFIIGVWCAPSRESRVRSFFSQISGRNNIRWFENYGFFGAGIDEHSDRNRYIELPSLVINTFGQYSSLSTKSLTLRPQHSRSVLREPSPSSNQDHFLQLFTARSLSHRHLCEKSASVKAILKNADRKNGENPIAIYVRSSKSDKYQVRHNVPAECQFYISKIKSHNAKI